MNVREFVDRHYHHFNAGELRRCVQSLEDFHVSGGMLFITLAGAMSTARIGLSLAPAIRAGLVHAISCTGANLEEDLFRLLSNQDGRVVAWRELTPEDDLKFKREGLNRVTDTCINEDSVRKLAEVLTEKWISAAVAGITKPAHEYLFEIIDELEISPESWRESWLVAARDCGIPIFTPGWADSTLGNIFAARVMDGSVSDPNIIASDVQRMADLAEWYRQQIVPIGFLQVGGGIAGDFPICVVPMLRQDLGEDVPLWAWFAQISESNPSYGGYSGAQPNEKISWDKLGIDTPKFVIESDATIVLPLIFQYLLEF